MTFATLTDRATRLLPRFDRESSCYEQPMRGLGLLRHAKKTAFEAAVYDPVLIVILQGRKETVLGDETYPMRAGQCLLVSHDLPVIARVTSTPYLALLFSVDLDILRDLYAHASLAHPVASERPARALAVHAPDEPLLEALSRYLALAETPLDRDVLAPLVAREIHYRLARAPFGGMLRKLSRHDSHESSIARAIALLRTDFRSPIEIPALARRVGMSPSSFHKHFHAITASSPLQYRKRLQLLEARRQLRTSANTVTAIAFEVGYESAPQFSRDYARMFGVSPREDRGAATPGVR